MKKIITGTFFFAGLLCFSSCGKKASDIVVYKIYLKNFPALKENGDQWDDGNFSAKLPDLKIEIKSGDELIWQSSILHEDADEKYYYRFDAVFSLENEKEDYTAILYDYDFGLNEKMGEVSFNPKKDAKKLPSSFTVRENGISVEFFADYVLE